MILSDYGKVVEKYIQSIESAYSDITMMNYVIMPNHIHMIVMIYSDDNIFLRSQTETSANDIIPIMIAAFKKFVDKEIGFNIWHRSYHDHVIRSEKGFETIWDYIEDNPARWKKDCFYLD